MWKQRLPHLTMIGVAAEYQRERRPLGPNEVLGTRYGDDWHKFYGPRSLLEQLAYIEGPPQLRVLVYPLDWKEPMYSDVVRVLLRGST